MLFFGFLWGSIQFTVIQTFLAQKIAGYYSKELNTTITINSLEIDFFNQLNLNQLYIEDLSKDTLFYIENLELSLVHFDWERKRLGLNLTLKTADINLSKAANEDQFNYAYILDYFKTEDDSISDFKWVIFLTEIQLSSSNFSYHNYHYPENTKGMDYNHFNIRKLDLNTENLELKSDTLKAKVNHLSLVETKGFEILKLSTDFTMNNELLLFKKLNLQTPNTDLNGDLSFVANSFKDYSDFSQKVFMSLDLEPTILQTSDLAFFVNGLDGLNENIYIKGSVHGTVSKLKARDFEIHLNKETFLIGDLDIRGLPDFEATFIHFDLKEFQTTKQGLRNLPIPPFTENKYVEVPENLESLGKIYYSGKFTGFYNDFVTFGSFSTALGRVSVDLALKESEYKNYFYNGKVKSSGFNFGKFFDLKELGLVSLDVDIDGSGMTKENLNANIDGKIESLFFNDYYYNTISLNGQFKKETFNGQIAINDKNLAFDFKGLIDLTEVSPSSNFELNVDRAKLAKLNLYNRNDSTSNLRFSAKLNTQGDDFDLMSGSLFLDSVFYQDKAVTAFIENFLIENQIINNQRELSIQSSLLDAKLEGQFNLIHLINDFKEDFNQALTDDLKTKSTAYRQDFNFWVNIKNTRPLTKVLIPELKMDSSVFIKGAYLQPKKSMTFTMNGDQLSYQTLVLDSLEFKFKLKSDSTTIAFEAVNFEAVNGVILNDFRFKSALKKRNLVSQIEWQGVNDRKDQAEFNINTKIVSTNELHLSFSDSYFNIKDSLWKIPNDNQISIDTSSFDFKQVKLYNANQSLDIDGIMSKNETDTLNLSFKDIDLTFIESIIANEAVDLKGYVNGSINLSEVYNDPFIVSNLDFRDLKVNGVDFKTAQVRSIYLPEKNAFKINSSLGSLLEKSLEVTGFIYPKENENNFDLNVNFNAFPISFFNPFTKGTVSELEGEMLSKFTVTGSFKQPKLNGHIDLMNSKLKVDYLNTYYSINDRIAIQPDVIGFESLVIKDEKGNSAIAEGGIYHTYFSDFTLKVDLSVKDFLSLNTSLSDNELFYGSAVTTGKASITGKSDELVLDLNLVAGKGTDFKIPLAGDAAVSNTDFITFTNSHLFKEGDTSLSEVDLKGIQLNFNLEIQPQAKVQIIFDQLVGDIIRAEGEGNIKMEINTLGDFNIYGEYEVVKGNYLFTLQNVINKRFEIEKGSRISWDGDPLRAKLDMRAIYNTRAPLYDLFPEDTNSNFRRRIPVDLELQMKGFIMEPEINFNILLPTADENTKQRLRSILYINNNEINKQEMNQQVFGLLVLNRFMPSSNSQAGYSARGQGMNNTYEMLSNQLSNMVSKMSDQFDVGVNYRPSNELTSEEIDVSVSTELLNDRLVLDGNFGYADNAAITGNQQNSNFIGEFTIEYKMSRDGRFRLKGFNRSTNNSLLQVNSPYTQGAGVFYREEFETFNELWRRYFHKKEEEE